MQYGLKNSYSCANWNPFDKEKSCANSVHCWAGEWRADMLCSTCEVAKVGIEAYNRLLTLSDEGTK